MEGNFLETCHETAKMNANVCQTFGLIDGVFLCAGRRKFLLGNFLFFKNNFKLIDFLSNFKFFR